jgi:hypothetical protein
LNGPLEKYRRQGKSARKFLGEGKVNSAKVLLAYKGNTAEEKAREKSGKVDKGAGAGEEGTKKSERKV